jgi:hypothetical protein
MREKRLLRRGEEVCGVRYDAKTKETLVGGPAAMEDFIREIWGRISAEPLEAAKREQSRIRITGFVVGFSWDKFRDCEQEIVRSFRRLMY